MAYSKPEIAVLGDATRVINSLGKPYGVQWDGMESTEHPAYDLDE